MSAVQQRHRDVAARSAIQRWPQTSRTLLTDPSITSGADVLKDILTSAEANGYPQSVIDDEMPQLTADADEIWRWIEANR